MKNVFKTLGIVCIIGAALFIAACGGGGTEDPETGPFKVTFDPNGGTLAAGTVSPATVEDGLTVPEPADPNPPSTPPASSMPTVAGLYILSAYTFGGWELGGVAYDFDEPVTKNITLKAKWNGGDTSKIDSVTAGSTDMFDASVTHLKTGSNADAGKYILVLDQDISSTVIIAMTKGDLTVRGTGTGKTITSPTPTQTIKVFLTISGADTKLTLNNIGLRGVAGVTKDEFGMDKLNENGTPVTDSLVRITTGATLIMDEGSSVKGHRNSDQEAAGAHGNGSAVCVYGGNLTMKRGSVIEQNESTATGTNKNRVGGVYTYVPSGGNVTLNIEGGEINNNFCKDGHTKDLYATEGGTFNLSGFATIGELTINADVASGNTDNSPAAAIPATITVNDLRNMVGTISLRSTVTSAANVKTAWTGKSVLYGPNKGAVASADVAKFTLGQFKWNGGAEDISEDYSITTAGLLIKAQ